MIGYAKKLFRHAVKKTVENGIHRSNDVEVVANYLATRESAVYYTDNMLNCSLHESANALLTYALERVTLDGLFCEFGVASGRTINHIAALRPDKAIHGFDGFIGLPEHWRPGFGMGAFAGPLPQVNKNVNLHVGMFDDTLPKFTAEYAENVAFLHVDCDLYSSTKTIFSKLGERIVPGTVIVFDEYFNYPGWRHHEWRAFREFIDAHKATYRYVGLVPSHQQVAVIIESSSPQ